MSAPTPLPTPTRLAETPPPRAEFTPVAPPKPLATATTPPRPLPTPASAPTPAPTADPSRIAALVAERERAFARTFVPDLPSSEAEEGPVKSVPGFKDLQGMDVRKAVKVPGRAELEATPDHVKPGDSYAVRVYLRNQDAKKKQKLRIVHVKARKIVNGQESEVAVSWKPLEVKHRERPLVASLSDRWGDDVTSWSLVVKVFVEGGDAYENRLVWK